MGFDQLLPWYQKHQRDLPFRNTSNPYHIWVAEIMLQQTQVQTMLPYYKSFLEKYPTIERLARTPLEVMLADVTGIGYYRRFKLMHQAANVIVEKHNGIFPNTYDAVKALPGIGLYTAGAIMSTAFHQPYSALDGNVMRVLARVFEISDDIRLQKTQKMLDALNSSLIIKEDPANYTHAMMELGATICKPTQPSCDICPLADICQGHLHQTWIHYPYKSKASAKKEFSFKTLVLMSGNYIALKKETQTLYEGMYLFPQVDIESLDALDAMIDETYQGRVIQINPDIKHIFTHQIWFMTPVLVAVNTKDPSLTWVHIDEISQYAIPTSHLKVYQSLKPFMTF